MSSTVSTPMVIAAKDLEIPTTSSSRKRPAASISPPSSVSSSSSRSKKPRSGAFIDTLSQFVSSKRTAPSVYSVKAKVAKTCSVSTSPTVSPALPQVSEEHFEALVKSKFPRAVFKFSETTWAEHYKALMEMENEKKKAEEVAKKLKEQEEKLKALLQRNKVKVTAKKVLPDLHPTMALREQLRVQRRQEAEWAKENGPEEVKPKKKIAVRKQKQFWEMD